MAELIWDGKYDEHHNKRAPVRIELPFQTVETVNESVQERQRTLELSSSGHDPEWRNRLIWGDKKYVLPSLLPEFAGKVDLIYIDPPFSSGQDFSFSTTLPGTDDEFTKSPSTLEQKAYRDTWGVDQADSDRGVTELDRYLRWLNETFVLLRELLSNEGSIFVHLDVHMGPYVKALMDEVFGRDNFQNEVVWYYYRARFAAESGHTGGATGKAIVVGMLDRDERKVRATVVPNVKRETLQNQILKNVKYGSTVYTDDAVPYDNLRWKYIHEVVNHAETYVRGQVHTNGLENFWSLLKRNLKGTYVCVEPFHLERYVDEQVFRYNNRATKDNPLKDSDRFLLALSQVAGKRLTFAELTGKSGSPASC